MAKYRSALKTFLGEDLSIAFESTIMHSVGIPPQQVNIMSKMIEDHVMQEWRS